MKIKILGTGCPNCKRLEANTQKAAEELGSDAVIEKVTDMGLIMAYGIMSTPALVVNEQVMSYGRIPDIAEIKAILSNPEVINATPKDSDQKENGCCSCGGKC